jgi:hypothetical protein
VSDLAASAEPGQPQVSRKPGPPVPVLLALLVLGGAVGLGLASIGGTAGILLVVVFEIVVISLLVRVCARA